jgi:hypothetical protein
MPPVAYPKKAIELITALDTEAQVWSSCGSRGANASEAPDESPTIPPVKAHQSRDAPGGTADTSTAPVDSSPNARLWHLMLGIGLLLVAFGAPLAVFRERLHRRAITLLERHPSPVPNQADTRRFGGLLHCFPCLAFLVIALSSSSLGLNDEMVAGFNLFRVFAEASG